MMVARVGANPLPRRGEGGTPAGTAPGERRPPNLSEPAVSGCRRSTTGAGHPQPPAPVLGVPAPEVRTIDNKRPRGATDSRGHGQLLKGAADMRNVHNDWRGAAARANQSAWDRRAQSPCRFARANPYHVCADRDGRKPPRELCFREAEARLAEGEKAPDAPSPYELAERARLEAADDDPDRLVVCQVCDGEDGPWCSACEGRQIVPLWERRLVLERGFAIACGLPVPTADGGPDSLIDYEELHDPRRASDDLADAQYDYERQRTFDPPCEYGDEVSGESVTSWTN